MASPYGNHSPSTPSSVVAYSLSFFVPNSSKSMQNMCEQNDESKLFKFNIQVVGGILLPPFVFLQ